MLEPGDWDAWLHGTAAQADALIKLPPLGVLRSGAEKPEEEALLPAERRHCAQKPDAQQNPHNESPRYGLFWCPVRRRFWRSFP